MKEQNQVKTLDEKGIAMRSSFLIGCLAVLVLFMCQFGSSTTAQQVVARNQQLLEYKVVERDQLLFTIADQISPDDKHEVRKLLEKALNKQAVEGWECSGGFQEYLIFKRRK